MAKTTLQLTIKRSADEVWATVGSFGDLRWRPGIGACVVSDGVRSVKTLGFDLEVDERELNHDDAQRTYSYGVIGFRGNTVITRPDGETLDLATMAGHHRATITVLPAGESTCTMVYDLEVDDGYDGTFESTKGQYRSVMERLKQQLEG